MLDKGKTRRPYVAANWKMHKTRLEAEQYFKQLMPLVKDVSAEVAVCPPFTALATAVEMAKDAPVKIAAQNMHEKEKGAFTGEVSAPMLVDIGVDGVVLGHSERRQHFHELDSSLRFKLPVALEAGLEVILCVGETESEREAGDTQRKLRQQVQDDLADVPEERLSEIVIAYEPIWAIGTGMSATPEDAQDAISFIRALVADRSVEQAGRMRILYGGSVKPDNVEEMNAKEDIDGALVGGASLDAESFAAICTAVR